MTKLPYPPLEVFIEPTNYCNFKCVICPQAAGLKRQKGFMGMDAFKDILAKIERAGAMKVTLHFAGEPLMNRDIFDMIKLASSKRLYTRMHTNAALLTADSSKRLLASGLDEVSFSFDDDRKEIYEKIRTNSNYDSTLANIRTFLECKRKAGSGKPFTIIQRIIVKGINDNDLREDDYKNLFLGLPVDSFNTISGHNWAGDMPAAGFGKPSEEKKYPCRAIWQRMAIGWDGKAFACCNEMDGKLVMGDLNKTGLMDVWNGERMVDLRKTMLSGRYDEIPACESCDVLYRVKPPKMNMAKEIAAKFFLKKYAYS
jgi:radical SAM protein with 4Fe4S-binding SPASM domain